MILPSRYYQTLSISKKDTIYFVEKSLIFGLFSISLSGSVRYVLGRK
jgi:hypothetical protein